MNKNLHVAGKLSVGDRVHSVPLTLKYGGLTGSSLSYASIPRGKWLPYSEYRSTLMSIGFDVIAIDMEFSKFPAEVNREVWIYPEEVNDRILAQEVDR